MDYKYQVTNVDTVYKGFYTIKIFKYFFSKFDGSKSNIISRELFDRHNSAGVIPYDPKTNQIILIEQIRTGVIANNEHPWLLEIVAGIIEPGDTAENTVDRESVEEANCKLDKIIPIYNYYMTPGGSNEVMNLYCGITDLSEFDNKSLIHGLEHEDEDIKVHLKTLDEAIELVENNTIRNATTIIAIQWLQLNHEKLKI